MLSDGLIFVSGASGYIGGRLLRPLADAGFRVRAGARRPEALAHRVPDGVEVVRFDALDAQTVRSALAGVDVAYYLVHSLASRDDYTELDRKAASLFGEAARAAGVHRIVYLGGLGEERAGLSEHLASRHEVGRILAASGVQTLEFRASIVIGSGSTSFEMVRNLVEKLPAMTTPRWVQQPAQPIAIENVVQYLTLAASAPIEGSSVFEIGGPEVMTYADILRAYAEIRGLRRLIVPVPVLSPWLSGWWLSLFTPLYARVGRHLARSLKHPTVVTNDDAARAFPEVGLIGGREAIERALVNEDREVAETRWSDALGAVALEGPPVRERRFGRLVDSRRVVVPCDAASAFGAIQCVGGDTGWYAFDVLWGLRGWLDQISGGVGSRRGKRDPSCALAGDTLDFWRVVECDPPRRILLVAEMRMPGRGWLEYELEPDGEGGTVVRQTAIFDARGVLGLLYWYALVPFHAFVFDGTLRGIGRRCGAERPATSGGLALRANESAHDSGNR